MERNNENSKERVDTPTKVVLVDDFEADFFIIKTILERLGCCLVWDYPNMLRLIANYKAYRTVSENKARWFKSIVVEQIKSFLEDDSIIWILDVCWSTHPSQPSPDRYGIDFMKEFNPSKPILISLSPNDAYVSQIPGKRFICKTNNAGEPMTEQFERELKDAIDHFRESSIDTHNNEVMK